MCDFRQQLLRKPLSVSVSGWQKANIGRIEARRSLRCGAGLVVLSSSLRCGARQELRGVSAAA